MYIDGILLLWLVMNGGCFLVVLIYIFKDRVPISLHVFFQWGKTANNVNDSSLFDRLLHVPNSWFTHFYIVGVLWTVELLYSISILCNEHYSTSCFILLNSLMSQASPYSSSIDCTSIIIGLVMLLIQVARRLFECLFVSVFTRRIHIAHYVVGIVFYLLVGASLVAPFHISSSEWCASCKNIFFNLRWIHFFAGTLFAIGSIHQYRCHLILAKLRACSQKTNTRVYRIPEGDWFEFVSSPHYFAEILIYISFVSLQNGCNVYLWLMLIFVVQNLSLGAIVTHNWYHSKFKEYPRKRFSIIPFVF